MEYIIEDTKTEAGARQISMTLNTYTHLKYKDAEEEMKRVAGL